MISSIILIQMAAMSIPGPNHFLIITKNMISLTERLSMVAGIATSGLTFFMLIGFSYAILSESYISFFAAIMSLLGSMYIFVLGVRTMKRGHIQASPTTETRESHAVLFAAGFMTNIANPKTFFFFVTLYSLGISQTNFLYLSTLVVAVFLSSISFHLALCYVYNTLKAAKLRTYFRYLRFLPPISLICFGIYFFWVSIDKINLLL